MTDEELKAIEARAKGNWPTKWQPRADIQALIAEVKRLQSAWNALWEARLRLHAAWQSAERELQRARLNAEGWREAADHNRERAEAAEVEVERLGELAHKRAVQRDELQLKLKGEDR